MKAYVDEELDRDWRRFVTPAKVTIRFRDGKTLESRVDYSKGHPRNPMTAQELAAKTADCAAFAARPLHADTAARLTSTVAELESIHDIATLVRVVTAVAEEPRC